MSAVVTPTPAAEATPRRTLLRRAAIACQAAYIRWRIDCAERDVAVLRAEEPRLAARIREHDGFIAEHRVKLILLETT